MVLEYSLGQQVNILFGFFLFTQPTKSTLNPLAVEFKSFNNTATVVQPVDQVQQGATGGWDMGVQGQEPNIGWDMGVQEKSANEGWNMGVDGTLKLDMSQHCCRGHSQDQYGAVTQQCK